jgi:hypothetical protein
VTRSIIPQLLRSSNSSIARLLAISQIVYTVLWKIAKKFERYVQKILGMKILMFVIIFLWRLKKDFTMQDFLGSRDAPRRKKRGEVGISRKVAPAVDDAIAAAAKAPDSGTPLPSGQPHRPWLVPGAGRL